MPNKTFQTRISLKYDTYQNWTTNNPVLLVGEIAITTVPTAQGSVSQVPAVMIKSGDGTSNYNDLPWASALAADVYPWAKASTKPVYQAAEIQGLEDFISGEIQDTNTKYQIVASGTNGIQLQSQDIGAGKWTNVGDPITITYTLAEGSANGTVSFNGVDVPVHGLGTAAYTDADAYDAAGAAASVQTALTGTTGDASTVLTLYGVKKYAQEQAAAAQTAAQGYADTQIGAAKTELIGTGDATATTIKGAVQEAKGYADQQIASKIGSVYKPAGSVTFANLPSAVTADMLGRVYNVTDEFVADGRFLSVDEGETYPAGSNVAVVEESEEYFYDVLSGNIDLSDYVTNTQFTQGLAGKIDNPVGGSNGNYLTKTTDGVAWTNQPVRVINVGASGTTVENVAVYAGEFLSGTPVFAYDTQSQQMIPCVSAADTGSMVFFGSGLNSSKVPGYFRYISIADSGSVEANEQVQINASQIPYAGDVTGDDVATAIDTLNASIDSAKPLLRTATLTTSGWSGNSQTVTVNGVLANESLQEINLAFGAKESAPIWAAAGCWCSAQGANSLTFTCDAVPTGDISLRIAITGAQT